VKKTVWVLVLMLVFNGFIIINQFMVPIVNAASPTATTNSTTNINENSVTLNGYLFDDGNYSSWCRFEYGLTNSYGTITDDFNGSISLLDNYAVLENPSFTTYRDVWCNDSYVFTCEMSGRLRAYSFDGSSFTLLDSNSEDYYSVWSDGTYIYTTNNSGG